MIKSFIKNHEEDISILIVLFSGLTFLSIFMLILNYNPDPILILCTFSLLLLWIYLVVSYQRLEEQKMIDKIRLNNCYGGKATYEKDFKFSNRKERQYPPKPKTSGIKSLKD